MSDGFQLQVIPPGTQIELQFNRVSFFFQTEDDAIIFWEAIQKLLTVPGTTMTGAHRKEATDEPRDERQLGRPGGSEET